MNYRKNDTQERRLSIGMAKLAGEKAAANSEPALAPLKYGGDLDLMMAWLDGWTQSHNKQNTVKGTT